MRLTVDNPNLSIIVPGGCNGHCSFCFWKQEPTMPTFLGQLAITLEAMPAAFQQISLTGGEPTLSGHLVPILERIDKARFPKLVLTTNGEALKDLFVDATVASRRIDHVNISRHAVDDQDNDAIFGAGMLCTEALREAIAVVHTAGPDVTLNCVLQAEEHLDVFEYIDFARSVGADAVSFRKQHGTLEPTEFESQHSTWPVLDESSCPVCRSKTQRIWGMTVTWKASSSEPSTDSGGIYEAIFHPTGLLTADWAGKEIIDVGMKKRKKCRGRLDSGSLASIGKALEEIGQQLQALGRRPPESAPEVPEVRLSRSSGCPGPQRSGSGIGRSHCSG